MAAGDVTIHSAQANERRGKTIVGEVQLDGANPTPVNLSAYGAAVKGAVVALKQTSAPGLDPSWLSCDWSGATLNVYAWKVTASGNATLIASTDNTAVVSFVAVVE